MGYEQRILPTCVVFGTNPANDEPDRLARATKNEYWRVDEIQRAQAAVNQVANGTAALVCVGGERFADRETETTMSEAESMMRRVRQLAAAGGVDLSGVQMYPEIVGRETLEQVEQTVRILRDHDLMHGAIGIISSWHQIPRVRYIFKREAGLDTVPVVANPPAVNERLFSHSWNLIAGFAYTALALEMQRHGKWQEGGPVISYYRRKRS